ncbi:hypothetical protein OS31_02270 [Dickeya oryzae]
MADSGNLAYRDRQRAFIDRLTRRIVVGSGWLVLLALLTIFLYLLYVVIPLFSSASIRPLEPVAVDSHDPTLALGINDSGRWAFRVDAAGNGEFIDLARGQVNTSVSVASSVTVSAMSTGERPLLVLGQADGALRVLRPDLPLSSAGIPQWRYPLGEHSLRLAGAAQPLRQLAIAESDDMLLMALIDAENRLQFYALSLNTPPVDLLTLADLQPVSQVQPDEPVQQLLLSPDGQQLYALSGNRLTVWQLREQALTARETVTLPGTAPLSLSLLAGGHSLLIKSADGRVSQWFDTPTVSGPHLSEIRIFPTDGRQLNLIVEPRRRVFATLDPQGHFSLFASKQSGELMSALLAPQARIAAFSPRGRALLLETDTDWRPYQLDNPYPDIGWRGLWQKLWYENYPEPDYVWQPTAADDSYQAKFSLVPLLSGTFKAALYAMLFAAPLALAAAIYTACFMTPTLRRWIKPAMEIMGALPTVVIGLIAALWLAPRMATYLTAILLLPLLWGGGSVGEWVVARTVARPLATRRISRVGCLAVDTGYVADVGAGVLVGAVARFTSTGATTVAMDGGSLQPAQYAGRGCRAGVCLDPADLLTGGGCVVQRTGSPESGVAGSGGHCVANVVAGGAAISQFWHFCCPDAEFWPCGGRNHDRADGDR